MKEESRLKEILELGYIPKQTDNIKFSDGSAVIGTWLRDNKTKLIKMAEVGYVDALKVCLMAGWGPIIYGLPFDEEEYTSKFKEIRELGYVPYYIGDAEKKSKYIDWISIHKKAIIKLAETNEDAKWICLGKGWIKPNQDMIKSKISEIRKLGYLPQIHDNIKFEDGSCNIGIWVSRNIDDIILLNDEDNEDAQWLVKKYMKHQIKRLDNITKQIQLIKETENRDLTQNADNQDIVIKEVRYVISKLAIIANEYESDSNFSNIISLLLDMYKRLSSEKIKQKDLTMIKSQILEIELLYDIPIGLYGTIDIYKENNSIKYKKK